MNEQIIPRHAHIRTDHIRDEALLGTLSVMIDAGIAPTFANLSRLPAILAGEAALPAEGEIFPDIPAEEKIPELYPPSCGGPQGWLSGIACDLSLFPGGEGAAFAGCAIRADGDRLEICTRPADTRLSGPYTAACAAFVRGAAELCAAGAGRQELCRLSVPFTAAGLSALCAAVDACTDFGCRLEVCEGEAALRLTAKALRPLSGNFSCAGNPVYFLAAPCHSDTLPDFCGTQASHAHFRTLAAAGSIAAARAVGAAGPAEAILSLCGEFGFRADPSLDVFAYLLLNFGGIVLEGKGDIPGALRIGTVSAEGSFLFPDGRGAKISDLAAYRMAARRAKENLAADKK